MKLKHLPILLMLAAVPAINSCDDGDEPNSDSEWQKINAEWLANLENKRNPDGTPYYKRLVAPWDSRSYVLIHYFEPQHTENLRPLFTSTVDVRYKVYTCDNTGIDSSTTIIKPVPGALRVSLDSKELIAGWPIAVTDMHVGDTCEVIVPYGMAYGVSGYMNVKPYSNLRFNLRLVDIPYYEVRP